ncbi:hypothetical protein N7494_001255 [Penicillium frequentans]|uniref:3'-5' exonuclease domain-containing protein n=1 Tax=Penicillium frequentans TaxID=3151616 RepID=A0AAD6D985_9EURO|nr:hypothetical protein N7494_001255 [Penicillium glabrum]
MASASSTAAKSTESTGIEILVIDSVSLLPSVIDTAVIGIRPGVPSLFIDLEGIQLGRHGSISIMSLYIPSKKRVCLIDIYRLGKEAFSTINSDGKSLKTLLESPDILKVLFDVRHDSDALFGLYGISVDGIRDVQLMELGTRTGSKEFLAGLKKCVEADSTITQKEKTAWGRTKDHARQLFDPSLGGRYEIFNERPIRQVIAEYCAGDVTLLPNLFNVYSAKLHPPRETFWKLHILEATKGWIKLSQSPRFDGKSRANARGPWDKESIEQAIDQWNDDIMDEAMNEQEDFDHEFRDIMDCEEDDDDYGWQDDGPTSCRDIINSCDYGDYYSD